MSLTLTPAQLNRLQAHAEAAYPHECCGLLLGHGSTTVGKLTLEVQPLSNAWPPAELAATAHTQASRYWIDPQDFLKVQRSACDRNLIILGIYHSHPDHAAIPSECDRTQAWSAYSYVIVSVAQGKAVDIQSWQLDDRHQFQSEPMKISPASAATDRMPRHCA